MVTWMTGDLPSADDPSLLSDNSAQSRRNRITHGASMREPSDTSAAPQAKERLQHCVVAGNALKAACDVADATVWPISGEIPCYGDIPRA
jgi:hypothetical protein